MSDFIRKAKTGNIDGVRLDLQEDPEKFYEWDTFDDEEDQDEQTALIHLCTIRMEEQRKEYLEIIKLLLQTARENNFDISEADRGGTNAFMYAMENQLNDIVDCFLENIDLVRDFNQKCGGRTLLLMAARYGFKNVIEKLKTIPNIHLDLEATDQIGRTALHWAAFGGHTVCVETLLIMGANVEALGRDGKSAEILASEKGHAGIATLLHDYALNLLKPSSEIKKRP